MHVFETPAACRAYALAARAAGRRIALVPTMGNLHEGHRSLIRIARARADEVVVSVFVNPIQFGPNEDYAAYPRTWADDLAACEEEGATAVFHPTVEAMYPEGKPTTYVTETAISPFLCGASRPGHFNGVCTVVTKLFMAALPDVAVFGEKDFQQLAIVRRMVRDLDIPVEIVAAPISREADGLARSSRNRFLPEGMRPQALSLRHALLAAKAAWDGGERDAQALEKILRDTVAREAPDGVIDYARVSDAETLVPLTGAIVRPALAALAVKVGPPRLIDNILLGR
ncbi:MAG: pantoate--beta-alanine ligase [Kiritimatiellae bacterium]|nr:pantoate--beta-alanine ligase [Kiritimatiellia bacterium]